MTDAELIRFALYADGLDLMTAEQEALLIVVNSACPKELRTDPQPLRG